MSEEVLIKGYFAKISVSSGYSLFYWKSPLHVSLSVNVYVVSVWTYIDVCLWLG